MIKIMFRSGEYEEWSESQYTDYRYLGDVFVVMKNDQWVGIYNMQDIRAITVGR